MSDTEFSNGMNSAEGFYNRNSHPNHSQENLNHEMGPQQQMRRFGGHRNKTEVGFERANWKLAQKVKEDQSNQYLKGEKVPYCVGVDHFKNYGPGIYLFFLFLKKTILLFSILTLVELVPMVYNFVQGDNFDTSGASFQTYIIKFMTGNLIKDDNGKGELSDKLLNAIPSMVSAVVFFIFYFYWKNTAERETQELKKVIKYPSDQTIEVKLKVPVDEASIHTFFSQFGSVKEVAAVRNYQEMIQLSKSAYEDSLQIKEHRLHNIASGQEEDHEYVEKVETRIKEYLDELQKVEQEAEKQILKYYVVFQRELSKLEVLEKYRGFQGSCYRMGCCRGDKVPDEELLMDGEIPEIKDCQTQPGGILWENMHISGKNRWLRGLLQFFLLLVLISFGFLLISLLNIMVPSIKMDPTYSEYTFVEIQQESDYSLVASWCVNSEEESAGVDEFCWPYMVSYYKKIAISVGISLSIVLFKLVLKMVVIAIAKLQRYKDHSELATNIMTNLMTTYICTTVLITFLLQANVFGISFKKFIKLFLKDGELLANLEGLPEYHDFTNEWYRDIGYQIWLNWLILSLIPHLFMPVYHCLRDKVGQCMGRRQVLQKNLLEWIQAEEFEIEDHYANVIMIIFVGFTFSGGIPFMIPISLIGLATRFLYFKFAFIRYSRVPKVYSQAITNRIETILPIMLLFHMLFSIWMLGVEDIFGSSGIKVIDDWVKNTVGSEQALARIISKFADTWYMTLLLALFLIIFIFKKIFVDVLGRLCRREEEVGQKYAMKDEVLEEENLKLTQVALTVSYKIENNPDYMEILAIMKPGQAGKMIKEVTGGDHKQLVDQIRASGIKNSILVPPQQG